MSVYYGSEVVVTNNHVHKKKKKRVYYSVTMRRILVDEKYKEKNHSNISCSVYWNCNISGHYLLGSATSNQTVADPDHNPPLE